jgi:hypothetical protein
VDSDLAVLERETQRSGQVIERGIAHLDVLISGSANDLDEVGRDGIEKPARPFGFGKTLRALRW